MLAMKTNPTFDIENETGFELVAGVDEAGRGPLCGPVVAAAVIFPLNLRARSIPRFII